MIFTAFTSTCTRISNTAFSTNMFSWIFTLTSTFIISCFEFIDFDSNYKKITVDNDNDNDDDDDGDDDDDCKLFLWYGGWTKSV